MAGPTSTTMSYEERQRSIFLLGPWLIGAFVNLFLQGVLCSQFVSYFTWRNNDGIGTRLAVVGLVLLTTLKAIHSIATVWIMLILNFNNLNRAIELNYVTWWQTGNALMVASIGAYVQIFLCYRIWIISKKNICFVLPIGMVLLFAHVSVCLATYYISQGANARTKIELWFDAHFSAVFAGDLMITSSTAYLLLKSKKNVLPNTVGILSALVRLTFQTAAPAALCAMFNLIFTVVYSGDDNLISVGFNEALSTLYALSMMWTLNARRSIRHGSGFGRDTNSGMSADSSNRRPGMRDDVELSMYGQHVHARTNTDIIRHVDIRFAQPPRVDSKPGSADFKMRV